MKAPLPNLKKYIDIKVKQQQRKLDKNNAIVDAKTLGIRYIRYHCSLSRLTLLGNSHKDIQRGTLKRAHHSVKGTFVSIFSPITCWHGWELTAHCSQQMKEKSTAAESKTKWNTNYIPKQNQGDWPNDERIRPIFKGVTSLTGGRTVPTSHNIQ